MKPHAQGSRSVSLHDTYVVIDPKSYQSMRCCNMVRARWLGPGFTLALDPSFLGRFVSSPARLRREKKQT